MSDIRELSKQLFGTSARLEVALAIARAPDGTVATRALAVEHGLAPSRVSEELRRFEELGLLRRLPRESREVMYERTDSALWEFCVRFSEEAGVSENRAGAAARRTRQIAVGIDVSGDWLARVVRPLIDHVRRRANARAMNDALGLLGLANPDVAFRSDAVHPLFPHQLHPDNRAALLTVASSALSRARDRGGITDVDELWTTLGRDMVLVGSPASEGLSRPLFGYRAIETDRLVFDNVPLDLPYRWSVDHSEVEGQRAKRFIPGHGLVARPAWQLLSYRGGRNLYRPEIDVDGLITTDYLLVSRLRNYLTEDALEQGRFILSIGGAHGTATRAIDVLLRDTGTLAQVADLLRHSPHTFQLLIEVGAIKHDPKRGSRATRVRLVDAVPLPDVGWVWESARRQVEPSLQRWLEEQPPRLHH